MKIYFAASIRGGRQDVNIYSELITHLKKHGQVLNEHIGDNTLTSEGEKNITEKEIHDKDIKWLSESDFVIAEVTTPSLGVGYELRYAIENNKKILCLYKPQEGKDLSAMILGTSGINNSEYSDIEEAKSIIEDFISKHTNNKV